MNCAVESLSLCYCSWESDSALANFLEDICAGLTDCLVSQALLLYEGHVLLATCLE